MKDRYTQLMEIINDYIDSIQIVNTKREQLARKEVQYAMMDIKLFASLVGSLKELQEQDVIPED